MKSLFKNNRKRIVAWVCAVVAVFGGVGTVFFAASKKKTEDSGSVKNFSMNSSKSDNGVISSGGTVESKQLCDYLGFESTNLRLKVDEVYVESGDTIEEGTAVYKITADSLEKAEKNLNTELQSAESALLNQKMQYTEDKNSAYALYQSDLLSGDNAESSLSSGLTSLDSDLQSAYSSYVEAINTVNSTPSEITSKQNQLNSRESDESYYQNQINDLQSELNEKKAVYTDALNKYNEIVSEYNAAAGTVQFIGNSIGTDVSDVQLAGIAESIQMDNGGGMNNAPSDSNADFGGGDMSDMPSDMDFSFGGGGMKRAVNDEQQNALTDLYNSARSVYDEKKAMLTEYEAEYKNAENEYRDCQTQLNECNTQLKECQNDVSSLTKEISSLKSKLTQAKSNITSLESKYNSLKSTYESDKLDLQQTYDSDEASGSNAEYNYQITLATIEADLEAAQEAYDTAENNLKIFKELLSDGIVKAQQSGIVYSVTYEAGNNMNVNSPLIYYVNESTYTTTVEVDQYDVIKINIGDEVTIYSSETGTETGTITSITAGETTSLADVNFNVTITANENSNLYTGESVNVYFNSSGMSGFSFEDANGGGDGKSGERGERGERPDFGGNFSGFGGGNMPEGFDPSNMPQGGGRP